MDVPFLLAGPIVRRARPDEVLIWIVVSKKCWLGAEAYRSKKQGEGIEIDTSVPIGEGTSEMRIQLSETLWIHLIKLVPNAAAKGNFPTREIIGYDILVSDNPIKLIETLDSKTGSTTGRPSLRRERPRLAVSQKRAQQLSRKPPVLATRIASTGKRLKEMPGVDITNFCLKGLSLPTFVLQESGKRDLTAYFASCRKLHGAGDDAARVLEQRLNNTATKANTRPTAMFLTGDQIYADDVADELIKQVIALGELVVGTEKLPDVSSLPREPKKRASIAKDTAKFTSGDNANHAFTTAEFVALYLLAWNPDLWKTDGLSDRLIEGRAGSRAMRRVLANIPTYMVFDDHEITDDWNLNEDWRDKVSNSSLGKRVIANGLATFLMFQGLGNQPEMFDDSLIGLLERRMKAPGVDGADDTAWDEQMLGFHQWAFVAPTTPKTLLLDPRTRRGPCRSDRDYERAFGYALAPLPIPFRMQVVHTRDNKPAILMDSDEIHRARKLVGDVKDQPLILVAQAPVLGIEGIEELARENNRLSGPADKDFESWRANPESFLRLFTDLLGPLAPETCVILSGDVHYAHVTTGYIEVGSTKIRVGQFTSSSLKNNIIDGGFAKGVFLTAGRASKKEVKRRLWWRRRDDATTRFEGDLFDDDLAKYEEDLIAELGEPDFLERFVHEDMGVSGQGILLEHNNMGTLTARKDVEVIIFGIAGGSHVESKTFTL